MGRLPAHQRGLYLDDHGAVVSGGAREGGSHDGWHQMAHTPAAGGGAVGVLLDQSGDGADARGGRRALRRAGSRASGL